MKLCEIVNIIRSFLQPQTTAAGKWVPSMSYNDSAA